jgi:S-adenosylmethionine:tRNA ribosyltransferase-isomerase
VGVDDPAEHVMHYERFELSRKTAEEIVQTRKNGGRIIAVGTTALRVLEHSATEDGDLVPSEGRTNLLVLPGYKFNIIDGLITNFHLPRSTLLMLVCAFASKDLILKAYTEALERGYRFYSYGDAMILL